MGVGGKGKGKGEGGGRSVWIRWMLGVGQGVGGLRVMGDSTCCVTAAPARPFGG